MHAYLIIAHNELAVLKRLIESLDYPGNGIYVHWDKKAGAFPEVSVSASKLTIIPKRVDVRWADYSMVEAELELFSAAFESGPYEYYHLVSGVDMPLKSQSYIHAFCAEHAGAEFIGFASPTEKEIKWRTQHYFIFTKDFRNGPFWKNALRKAFVAVQDMVGFGRNDCVMKKGSQWVSVSNDFVAYILEHKEWIYKTFNHTFCPDEMFIQTLCWNSPLREKVFDIGDEFGSCRRYIKWVDGNLLPITAGDIPAMRESPYWFARKFSSDDAALLDSIKQLTDA